MTAILALMKEIGGRNYVIHASDSLICRNNDKVILKNCKKYFEFPNFTILYAGSATVSLVIEDILNKKLYANRQWMKMRDKQDCHELFCAITKKLKSRLDDLNCPMDGCDDFTLLVVTKTALYNIDPTFTVESDKYVAGGSGEQFILPVLLAGYAEVKSLDDLKQLALSALSISKQLTTTIDEPFIVKELT